MISVIIPAHQEEGYIGDCLRHVLASDPPRARDGTAQPVQVIVVANGCADATAQEARSLAGRFAQRGWPMEIVELAEGSKPRALNAGDRRAIYDIRVYMDADIWVSPGLIAGLAGVLDRPEPAYAGGRSRIRDARGWFLKRYARFWLRLPFMASGVPGCGVYAVNAAGRARWGDFPEVTADDMFVRYHFAPEESHPVPEDYVWPIAGNFAQLVRSRRRQDEGLAEIRRLLPEGAARSGPTAPSGGELLRLFLSDPVGFAVYASVALAVRTPLFSRQGRWDRGR
ncbi:glycosyltransferase [Jhaorihella thermophila]|uniref:Glycosyl transferase family 2 n=1 Tax=Jhaorihella thermophila TaxID=488547 RepID=A0A1H5SCD7_9RHOB|nr:glycosyltransferase [Jhaorihella thermophila]SEF48323.1 Glycosyl transferase family 2 [Jhaorihella thermophila]